MSGSPEGFGREVSMARNLMIQGTMSGAGKSILTAGILRVLRQDGFRVAPFKSQNMALNSFVTRDGLEMGRAQAVQAAAAGIEPSSDMNPILLKPMGDAVSEVIVNGRPIGKMRAADYYRVKKSLVPQILEAYHRLEEQAEIIVIEGAGSPVEINLREGDFVNMGLAQMVDAPVLLAGNIDPGGVFAQLLGTVQLLRPEERERVKGLIINKFRGDVKLLEPGLSMFREYCDIPFAGVVPWLKLNLDEEDSLSDKLSGGSSAARPKPEQGGPCTADSPDAARPVTIDIAVIKLPYMSNYTDFTPLEQEDGVNLYYVSKISEMGMPDLILLPGTRNTIEDLRWLKKSGLARWIDRLAGFHRARNAGLLSMPKEGEFPNAPLLMGICGGYQMLGKRILDPFSSEAGGAEEGLDLLPVETVFRKEKLTKQSVGRTCLLAGAWTALSDFPVSGYEIHMGETVYLGNPDGDRIRQDGLPVGSAFANLGGPDGAVSGSVLGTYLHGIFDEPAFRKALIALLRDRKGTAVLQKNAGLFWSAVNSDNIAAGKNPQSARQMQDRQLDILANVLREYLDWKLIYKAIGI